jgi:hypothetical protein
VDLTQGQGGPNTGPPQTSSIDNARARGHALSNIDKCFNFDRSIERLLKATPKDYDPNKLQTARDFLMGYMRKLGDEQNAHPPDDFITAQFLAIAEWPRLEAMLYDLMAERKAPAHSYAWFVTVAIQRMWGLAPGLQKEARQRLKLQIVKPGAQTAAPSNSPTPADLATMIEQAAAKKGMR